MMRSMTRALGALALLSWLAACDKPSTPAASADAPATQAGAAQTQPQAQAAADELEPLKDLPEPLIKGFQGIMGAYLDAQEGLADSRHEDAKQAIDRMLQAIEAFKPEGPQAAVALWQRQQPSLTTHARAVKEAAKLQLARDHFQPLTLALKPLVVVLGNPMDEEVRLAYCPMAFGYKGGDWFQRLDKVDNVYHGDEMRRCGKIHESLPKGAHLPAIRLKTVTGSPGAPQPESQPTPSHDGHHHH